MITAISVFFFKTLQLACFLSGFFMIMVGLTEVFSQRAREVITRPRWYFGILAGAMGTASVLAFLPRLLDKMVFWLVPPKAHIGAASITSLLLLYSVSGGIFCLLSGRPRRSLTVFLLILSSSLMATYLEFL